MRDLFAQLLADRDRRVQEHAAVVEHEQRHPREQTAAGEVHRMFLDEDPTLDDCPHAMSLRALSRPNSAPSATAR